MSHTNFIKELLNILDLNITFNEQCFTKERINERICMVFSGTLDYKAQSCPHCACTESTKLIRWGFVHKPALILLNDVSDYTAYLRLKKRRFFCHECQRTFVAQSSVVDKGCSLSRKVKLSIAQHLTRVTSMTEIARQKNVSVSSVYRVLYQFHQPKKIGQLVLPEVLCVDEFKSVKQVSGAMSFIMMDGQTHQLIDVVENRQLHALEKYFLRYSYEARQAVKFVVCDLYRPYFTLTKKLFPNAQLIADRFHVVQLMSRSFLSHRIQRMKDLRQKGLDGQRKYRHLKKYWKLLQKSQTHLNEQKRHWRPSFRAHLTESDIVDRLLTYDEELKRGYTLYQEFLYAFQTKNHEVISELIHGNYTDLPEIYQTTLRTLKKIQPEIIHAFVQPYSNGPLESLNNRIKVLKRNAYGFRSFYNFKLRIHLCFGQTLFQCNQKA